MPDYFDHIGVTFDTVTSTFSITGLRRMDAEDLAEDLVDGNNWMITRGVGEKLQEELDSQPKPLTPNEIALPLWQALTPLQQDIVRAHIAHKQIILGIKWLRAEKALGLRDAKYVFDLIRNGVIQ